MKKILALALLALFLPVCALASALVQPNADFYVGDFANVLSDETRGHIILNNDVLFEACGAQIVVVTLDTAGTRGVEEYAIQLFNEWGVGSSDLQNGFLLLMTIRDDDYYAVVGKGLEAHLTPDILYDYLDEYLEPDFAAKKYDEGARTFFDAVYNKIAEIYGEPRVNPNAYAQWANQAGTVRGGGGGGGENTGIVGGAPNVTEPDGIPENQNAANQNRSNNNTSAGGGGMDGFVIAVILIIVLVVFNSMSRGFRRYRGGGGMGSFWGGFLWGSMMRPRVHRHHRGGWGGPRPGSGPRPGGGMGGNVGGGARNTGAGRSSGGGFSGGLGGGRSGGGGGTRGMGVGRSSGGFGSGLGGRPGGFGGGLGGGRTGGGGGTRGMGAGRGRR